jgi:transcriptional regulator with XRE-family HTH domain
MERKPRYDVYVAIRDAKGMTDAEVADRTGITRSTFSDWKSGRTYPGGAKLVKLSDLFGCHVVEFYDNNDADSIAALTRVVNQEEYRIIQAFRSADSISQEMVYRALGIERKSIESQNA